MAKPKVRVQHLVVCPSATVGRAGPLNPYTLHDVCYVYEIPADAEFPVLVPELWLYVRFFDGVGSQTFGVDVVWLDAPGGEAGTCSYALPVVPFGPTPVVLERAWRLNQVRLEGPGRCEFRLHRGLSRRVLGSDFIEVRRAP
jgi:hypothetical protein